jgi:hypothetical protein
MRRLALLCAVALAAPIALAQAPNWRDATSTLPTKDGRGFSMNAKAGDIDRDGDLDLVIAMEFQENRLLLNDGAGRFTDASDRLPRAARDSEEMALADFDRDGDLDIAVANEDDLKPELYLNDGRGRFADASARLQIRVKANAVVAFDADGDADQDLFFGGDKVSHFLINNGRGRFSDESYARLPERYGANQDVAVGDIDGDRDLDLVLGNENGNQIYLNDGAGRFALAPPTALARAAAAEETRDVELFDVDGDGDLDLFFANVRLWNPTALAQNRLLLNDGRGAFTDATAAWLPQREESTVSALAVDLDGDARPDLVTAARAANPANPIGQIRTFQNDGARFVETTQDWLPPGQLANGFDIVAADFDGDGAADLFVTSRGGADRLLLTRK